MRFVDMNGQPMPALGFGTFRLEGEACRRMVATAIDLGYRHIDTAQIYGNEAEVGAAIAASGIDRAALFVTTKLWVTNARRQDALSSTAASLDKLRTDYVDLLLIHWPRIEAPLAETLGAMAELKAQGRVRHIGVSNFTVPLMRQAAEEIGADIACNQVEYHPYLSQRPVLDYARTRGIAVTAYSPVARGRVADDPALAGIAARHGKTPSQVALRWLIEQPGVAAIPKTATPERAAENLSIFDFELTAEDMAAVDALARPDGRMTSPGHLAPQWDT